MRQGLSLRVSQHLALTPQLQQSIRLLQLSTLELQQEVEQMLDDNPFLEADAEDLPPGPDSAAADRYSERVAADDGDAGADGDWAGADDTVPERALAEPAQWDEVDRPADSPMDEIGWDAESASGPAPARDRGGDDDFDATTLAQEHETLPQHLWRQALSLRLSPTDQAALRFLIESLNDDGYLEDSLDELASSLDGGDALAHDELVHRFTVALGLLQSLEPAGVGARDLAECLRLQLQTQAARSPDDGAVALALRLCRQPVELLARRDFRRLVQLTGEPEARVRDAMAVIIRLDPKPGRRFIDVERNIIVPDVIAVRAGRGAQQRWRAQLNPDVMPRLRLHDAYAQALRSHKGEGSQALQQRLQEARWFIKNIQQRFDTILRVSDAIIERQKNFFMHGELAMRPLVLREIADELGLHESTISRVTTAKYMATPYGTFELKYFFGSSLSTETGGNASSTAVRALIRQFVAAEDALRPLSDNQISDMLKEQGIECARRTVAKYREALKIAPANLRRSL